ncbi:hypothetical protein IAT38_005033 [Cryptococcus sp. DSM 104549]
MTGLMTTFASAGESFIKDMKAAEWDEKSSKSETSEMIGMLQTVLESNSIIIKKLDGLDTIIKKLDSLETGQKQLATHLKALTPSAPVYTASADSAGAPAYATSADGAAPPTVNLLDEATSQELNELSDQDILSALHLSIAAGSDVSSFSQPSEEDEVGEDEEKSAEQGAGNCREADPELDEETRADFSTASREGSGEQVERTNVRPLPAVPEAESKPSGAASVTSAPHSVTPPAAAHPAFPPASAIIAGLAASFAVKVQTYFTSSSPTSDALSPGANNNPSLALGPAQWLDSLQVCIQTAKKNRERGKSKSLSSDMRRRAENFVYWYFPRHGCKHPSFQKNKVVISGEGTLEEEWAWDVQMMLGGRVVWEVRRSRWRYAVESEATEDLARAVMALDPQAWTDFASKNLDED